MGTDRRTRLILLGASALLLTLAQPPFPTGWLAYGALVPYLFALKGLRGRRAFLWGAAWSLLVNTLGLYWIILVTAGGFVAALVYLSLLDGLFTWLLTRVPDRTRPLLLPFLWTAFLWVKSLGQMGFPWLTLGLTQTYSAAALQLAPVAGAWLIDAWVCGINALLYIGLNRITNVSHEARRVFLYLRAFGPAAALALVVLLYGRIVIGVGVDRPLPEASPPLRVAAVQGSVVPAVKLARGTLNYQLWLYERLSQAAEHAAGPEGLDLVIWPETAVPEYLEGGFRIRQRVQGITERLGVPVITGAFAATWLPDGGYRYYNAAFLADSTGLSLGDEVYRKRILVPFGERVPYQALFGFLKPLDMGWSDFSLGEDVPLIRSGQGRLAGEPVGVLICYESLFARMVRPEVRSGARLLTIITNDAWFGRTSGPYQHLRAASLRAAEFRRPIVRSANSGVSAFIDRWGRCEGETPLYRKTAAIGTVRPEGGLTPYARWGDWFPVLCTLLSGALIIPKKGGTPVTPAGRTG